MLLIQGFATVKLAGYVHTQPMWSNVSIYLVIFMVTSISVMFTFLLALNALCLQGSDFVAVWC